MALDLKKDISPSADAGDHQKINFFLMLFYGLITVLASAAAYLFILKEFFGSFAFADLIPSAETFKNLFNGNKAKIAVLYSNYTAEKLSSVEELFNNEFTEWEIFFRNGNYEYDIIDDQTIENGDHFNYVLIVLPQSVFLSDQEADQLKNYIKNGGSLFASGQTAEYSDDGSGRGWSFLSEVFNLRFAAKTIIADSIANSFYLKKLHQTAAFRGGIPLTSGIPAGYKMKISAGLSGKKIELTNENVTPISFNQNYNEDTGNSLNAAYGINEKGRFVWMDFYINSVKEDDRLIFDKFISNSINWLIKKPIAYIKDFPGGYDAAAIIAPVLSDSIQNIYNILKILSDENIKASFFISPEKSIENLPLTANLGKYGETGVFYYSKPEIINKNFSFYNILRKESAAEAIYDLKKAKRTLEQITGSKCSGCILYPEFSAQQTYEIIQKAGFSYLLTDSAIVYSPKIEIIGRDRSLTIFESFFNNLFTSDSGMSKEEFDAYEDEINRILNLHSLYILKFRIEHLSQIMQIERMKDLIRYLKYKNVWITTASEYQEWLYKKLNLEINADRRGERRVYLQISNTGKNMAKQVAVDVDLNEISGITNVYLNLEFVSDERVKVLNIGSNRIISLLFEDLKPGESRNCYIDYSPLNILAIK